MNIKKIKMALTIGLLRQNESGSALNTMRDILQNFSDEVGAFLGLQELGSRPLNSNIRQRSFALEFERCTLNVDLVANHQTQTQEVKSFHLR
jgi:hypothetical protein